MQKKQKREFLNEREEEDLIFFVLFLSSKFLRAEKIQIEKKLKTQKFLPERKKRSVISGERDKAKKVWNDPRKNQKEIVEKV